MASKTLDNSVPCFLSCKGFYRVFMVCHLSDPTTHRLCWKHEKSVLAPGVLLSPTGRYHLKIYRLILFSPWIPHRLQLCFDSYQQEQSVSFSSKQLGILMQPRCVRLGLGGCVRVPAIASLRCCLCLNLCLPLSPLQSGANHSCIVSALATVTATEMPVEV